MPHSHSHEDHHKHHDSGGHHHGGGGGHGGSGGGGHRDGLRPFAEGTSDYPTPIQGLGGTLTAAAAGGNVATLTPIPKTGFVGVLKHTVSGTITVGTLGAAYTLPLWRLMQNYTLQNSLAYPYRNLNGDDIWQWANISSGRSNFDPITSSLTFVNPVVTATGSKPFQFSFTDNIALNDGVNFSKYLLAALTNSNDLTINVQWLAQSALATLVPSGNAAVYSSYTASDAVSAVFDSVPDPDKYYWPDTSKVQQVIGDPSFSQTAVGLNSINLTPISGPDFLGLGIQVLGSGGVPDTLVPATSGIGQVQLLVGGSIPLKTFSLADLIRSQEDIYGRSPANGYLYLDMCSDLGIPNNMSATMRKALATTKYAQMTVAVTLNSNYTPGSGGRINLLKRTQQSYAGNAAIL